MNCPLCNQPMRKDTGLRGIAPNYWTEVGWRCTSGWDCELVGFLLYEDVLANPAKIQEFAGYNRHNRLFQEIHEKRKAQRATDR